MTIQEYFNDWSQVIDLNEADSIVKRLSASSMPICPQLKDVFKAFRLCSFSDLRCVIIGQDPYNNMMNGVPVATGIAFANNKTTSANSLSPSLEVLKESVIDYTIPHGSIIFDPSFEKWEEQGVLMLNSALTCIVGQAGSHSLLWRPFIKTFLERLSHQRCGLVYLLMGQQAQSFEPYICHTGNHILKTPHPSWYAGQEKRIPSEIWKQINNILISQNGYWIKWYEEH